MFKKLTKGSRVTLVELPPWQFGELNGGKSFDEYSYFRMPPRALPTLEAVLRRDKWKDVMSINPNGKLSEENLSRISSSDVLLISFITRTAPPSYEFAMDFKEKKPDRIVVFGGPHATFKPDEALRYGDIVVIGEGEKTLKELLNRLIKDRYKLDDIKGIAFKRNGQVIFTPSRELMSSEELSEQPHPYYNKETIKRINVAVVETTRGCPNKCKFCSVWKFGGGKYRTKSIDYVIEELERIKGMGKSVFITDDNFTASPGFLDRLSYEVEKKKFNNMHLTVQVDVNGATPERIKALKRMGVHYVCIGLESDDNETLKQLGKPFDAEQNKEAAIKYGEAKLWRHGMFMLGLKETPDTIRKQLRFASKYTDSAQFFPLAPIPGSDLREVYEKQGIILSDDWYLYDGHHVLLKPENMTPYEMQLAVKEMYKDYYSLKESWRRAGHSPDKMLSLKLLGYTQIMCGVKKVFESPQTLEHLRFLKSIS